MPVESPSRPIKGVLEVYALHVTSARCKLAVMPCDENLAERVRKSLADQPRLEEKKMFGGLCFMVNGNMCCGIVGDDLMLRVGNDGLEAALKRPHARPMDFTGTPSKGMVYVAKSGVASTRALMGWVKTALDHVGTRPPKESKPKKTPAKKGKAVDRIANDLPPFTGFPKETLTFLRELDANNRKDWFEEHRADYDAHYLTPALAFIAALGPKLQRLEKDIEYEAKLNGSLFRIHRDTRFAKDKTPYKAHIDLWFWDGNRRGFDAAGFFFRLAPKRLILGAGMHRFDKERIAKYRTQVDGKRGAELETTLQKVVQAGPYRVGGETLKKVPKGFAPDHPRASLLRHEGLWVELDTKPPKELHGPGFLDFVLGHFKAMAPVYRWLSTR